MTKEKKRNRLVKKVDRILNKYMKFLEENRKKGYFEEDDDIIPNDAYPGILSRVFGEVKHTEEEKQFNGFVDGIRDTLKDKYLGKISQEDYNLLHIELSDGKNYELRIIDCENREY